MDDNQQKRLKQLRLYEKLGNAGRVCLKCGISRPTMRKWQRRYRRAGIDGLKDESRRPQRSPRRKVTPDLEALIFRIRQRRNFGVKMIRSELLRLHRTSRSLATIHKVLTLKRVGRLQKCRRRRVGTRR